MGSGIAQHNSNEANVKYWAANIVTSRIRANIHCIGGKGKSKSPLLLRRIKEPALLVRNKACSLAEEVSTATRQKLAVIRSI